MSDRKFDCLLAQKYPTVGDLKIGPGRLYWLASKDCRLTPDQINALLDIAKDRWIEAKDFNSVPAVSEDNDNQDPEPNDLHASAETEIIGIAAEPENDNNDPDADTSHGAATLLDHFDAAMCLMLTYAAMPAVDFVGAPYAPATSAGDIRTVGNFLITVADTMEERALDKAA